MNINNNNYIKSFLVKNVNRHDDFSFNIDSKNVITTFVNPLTFRMDTHFFEDTLTQFDNVYCDGGLLAKFLSFSTKNNFARVSFDGNSLACLIFRECVHFNLKIAIIGSTDGNLYSAAEILKKNKLRICYKHNGFFDKVEEKSIIQDLKDTNPDIIILGLGGGKQEELMVKIKAQVDFKYGFTCGGYIDQIASGKSLQFYPNWVNKYHLRAFYRLIKERKNLLRRYLLDYSTFYKEFLKEIIK
jgi:exopolysaccharide biosynthesis WecB/TagA/CpsF family protein